MADIETFKDLAGLPNHMVIHRMSNDNPPERLQSYTVLVNPESYRVSRGAEYNNEKHIQSGLKKMYFNHIRKEVLNIELLFDATGSLGNVPLLNQQGVLDQINYFLSVTFIEDAPESKAKPLQLIWGPMQFEGVLENVIITYSHFDPTGIPIRAKAACTFTGGALHENYQPKVKLDKNGQPKKVVDYAKQKHAINAVLKYGSYVAVIAQQPRAGMPKSLRIAEQVAKLIIR